MSYRIRYCVSAKDELNHLMGTYGREFQIAFPQWIRDLATFAEDGNNIGSVDAFEVLGSLDVGEPVDSKFEHALKKFGKLDWREKITTLVAVLKNRCPPWEFRMSMAWFPLLECINHDVEAYYAIDHAKREIIFYKFELGDGDDNACIGV